MHIVIGVLLILSALFAWSCFTAWLFQLCFNVVAEWQGWRPMSFWVAFAIMFGLSLIGSRLRASVKANEDKPNKDWRLK